MRDVLLSECSEASTGRVVSTDAKDISLCDILGTGSDYLFLPYEQTLYVLMKPTPIVILMAISILTVYMTVILAHNLEDTVQESKDVHSESNTLQRRQIGITSLLSMITLIFLSLFSNGRADIWERLVTIEDECALSVLILYILYHVIRYPLPRQMNNYKWVLLYSTNLVY
jgi:hypothetical protein